MLIPCQLNIQMALASSAAAADSDSALARRNSAHAQPIASATFVNP